MNELQVFNFEDNPVRTVLLDGEPWFVAKDVADVLEYVNPQKAVRDHVDDEDRGVNEMDTPGGRQSFAVINESGLYSLVLSSKQEKAKRFKRWVTAEVLPAVRKTGKYEIPGRSNGPSMNDKLLVVDMAAKMLNLNDASKILMLGKFCKQEGIPSDFLPSYEQNGGKQLIAVSTLLKEFDCELGPVNFNKLLIANGFLEERTRPSTKDETKIKKFKALTEKAAKYGENQISPQNPREVQPMYYRETFMELYKLVTEETEAEEETE